MKKTFIIPMALAATLTGAMTSLINIETYVDDNQTEFNIEFKNVDNNIQEFSNWVIKFEDELKEWHGYDWYIESLKTIPSSKDLKILVPNLETLDLTNLNNTNESADSYDSYEVGLKFDIDILVEWENSLDGSFGEEVTSFPLYSDNELFLNYDNYDDWDEEKKFFWDFDPQIINKEFGEKEGEDWIYDISSISDFWMKDYSWSDDKDINNKQTLSEWYHYLYQISYSRIDGKSKTGIGSVSEDSPEEFSHLISSFSLAEGSKNQISLYARKTNTNGTSNKASVIDEQYLIETETFTQKDIDNAKPYKKPLSGGAIAGIVIGSIAGVSLLGAGGYWVYTTKFS